MVMPVGPLMIEHRLIERMIGLMKREIALIEKGDSPNIEFLDKAVGFIRNYADKCHHGKEENILFRELQKKTIPPELKKITDDLIQEHIWGRQTTAKLVKARNDFVAGNTESLALMVAAMKELVAFYPKHIEKEDKRYFLPIMKYFSKEEQQAMLEEGKEFDRVFIHKLHNELVQEWEKKL